MAKKINFNEASKNKKSDFSENIKALNEQASTKPIKTNYEKVPVDEINLDPKDEFTQLLPFNQELVNKLKDEIINNEYDEGQPVYLFKIAEEPESGWFLGDGHHRRLASILAGKEAIPVIRKTFDTRKQAILFAYHLQIDRRNIDDSTKYKIFKQIDELKKPGRKSLEDIKNIQSETDSETESLPSNSAAEEGKLLGISTRQISKLRNIEQNASDEIKAELESGAISINQADKKTTEQKGRGKKKTAQKETVYDSLSDSISDKSGEPMGLNFNHSDGIERPTYKLSPEEDNERTRERKTANELGFIDGFLQAADYIFSQLRNNVFMEEIEKEISKAKKDYEKLSALVSTSEESVIDEDDDGPELDFGDESEKTSAEQDLDLTDDDSDDAFNLGLD